MHLTFHAHQASVPCFGMSKSILAIVRYCQLSRTGVAVEKLDISEIGGNLGDRKCLTEQRGSFVEHPDAMQFPRISGQRVFQHAQAVTPTTRMSVIDFTPVIRAANRQISPETTLGKSGVSSGQPGVGHFLSFPAQDT